MKKTKSCLVEDIIESFTHRNIPISAKNVTAVVDAFIHAAKDSLMQGSPIELRGFGTFELRRRKIKHNARNPRTGTSVYVPSHTVVAFKSGKELRSAVWNLKTEVNTEV